MCEDSQELKRLTEENEQLRAQIKSYCASQVHQYHFADVYLEKLTEERWKGSGFIMEITSMGGKELMGPVLIREGFQQQTIEALRGEIVRSYIYATQMKPKGV